jgi:hypothetical protein
MYSGNPTAMKVAKRTIRIIASHFSVGFYMISFDVLWWVRIVLRSHNIQSIESARF